MNKYCHRIRFWFFGYYYQSDNIIRSCTSQSDHIKRRPLYIYTIYMYHILKVSFPGAIYRNKTQFNGKIYWNRYSKCWTIFQLIHLLNWDICHIVGSTLVSYIVEVCHLGLEPLWHLSLPLCHSENSDAEWTGIWGVRKDGNYWARGPGYRVDND